MSSLDRKPWHVWDTYGRLLRTVWAERKYYVGRA
jgi:hypothetical protein